MRPTAALLYTTLKSNTSATSFRLWTVGVDGSARRSLVAGSGGDW